MKMKMKIKHLIIAVASASLSVASCTTMNKSIREPNSHVRFERNDFNLSPQVNGEAQSVTIIGIDWSRLFIKKTSKIEGGANSVSLSSIPVVGDLISDKTANYALYDMMTKNPDYDVVFYPQYETKVVKPIIGIGFLTKITTVKAKARLAKFK
jgi:hypothetical protein